MYKFLLCLLILLTLSAFAYPQGRSISLTKVDGTDWTTWTWSEKEMYIAGFMTASYATLQFLVTKYQLDQKYIDVLSFSDTTVEQIIYQVNKAYRHTYDIHMPVFLVIYRTHLEKTEMEGLL